MKLFWLLHPVGHFKDYVSVHGIQCFTWKDNGANNVFDEYVRFIEKESLNKAVMEIEIKGNKE